MNTKKAAFTVLSIAFKIVIFAVIVMGVIRLGSLAFSYGHAVFQEEALDEMPGRTIQVTVEEGSSAMDIAKLLERKGLVEDSKLFYLQILCSKYAKTMEAGTYTLSTAMKPRELMAVMSGEEIDFDWGNREQEEET